LPLKELPEAERFSQLRTTKKHFVDTIKLIAYRAETALVALARERLSRLEDARSLIRQIFESAVDLCPNPAEKTLTVRVYRLTNAIHDGVLQHLCAELTATETIYPGTDLGLWFLSRSGPTKFHEIRSPETCFFMAWNAKWSLATNQFTRELLASPSILDRQDLPEKGKWKSH